MNSPRRERELCSKQDLYLRKQLREDLSLSLSRVCIVVDPIFLAHIHRVFDSTYFAAVVVASS